MASESWVLDSLILTGGTFALMDLVADPPRERQDWVAAADSESAALFRQPKHENRTITMKLRVAAQASMDTALDKVGLLVDKLRAASSTPAGLPLVWTPAGSTRARTFTVLTGEITGLPIALSGDGYSWLLQAPIVTVELTCQPYWVGTETVGSTASTSTPFVTQTVTATGDVPALGRLIVTDTATQSRRHVEWGIEGPLTYNAATSLMIDSDDLVTTGFAGTGGTTPAGAYDPNASGNSSVSSALYAGQTIGVAGTGNLSHVGIFRVKARVYGTLNTLVRLSWRTGDGTVSANPWATVSLDSKWIEVDLGTITLDAVVSGTQRWTGTFEAYGANSATIAIDYMTLVPASDGYGKARGLYAYPSAVTVGFDSFTATTAAAALNARVASLGGTWATSGVATDFAFADDLSDEQVKRSTNSEASRRFAVLGSTSYTNTDTAVNVRHNGGPGSASSFFELGVIARWTDSSNYLVAYRKIEADATASVLTRTLVVEQIVAGVTTVLGTTTVDPSVTSSDIYHTIRVVVFSTGRVVATHTTNSVLVATVDATSTTLATGGTLASGKPGFLDRSTGIGSVARHYDAFTVATPPPEPMAIFSGRTLQIRYDDAIRDDSTGTYTGRPSAYRGSRFLIPVGTSRVLVKARRNDVETAGVQDDQVTDSTQIAIAWTPRGLAVPR